MKTHTYEKITEIPETRATATDNLLEVFHIFA